MELRKYRTADCPKLAELFYDTVHSVNRADYTEKQVNAWADGQVNLESWDASLREHYSLVAVEKNVIIGFGDMDATGYLDRLFVHKDFQRQGIASAICDALEQAVGAAEFTTHSSITARPFFEKRGYRVIWERQVERHGVLLANFIMKKGG